MMRFADRLELVMKVLALSRGQLAVGLAVDKSLVSRWLTGASEPGNHNLARLTGFVAERAPGFTMLDWEADLPALARRLGLEPGLAVATPPSAGQSASVPDLARLPAMLLSRHQTAALGDRYTGLWATVVPSFSQSNSVHREHLVLKRDGDWLSGRAIGYCYEWPVVGLVANNQLLLWLSDTNDYIIRLFARPEGPIVEQLDGLMLAAASLPSQPPTCARIVMERLADAGSADAALIARASERRQLNASELDPIVYTAVLPQNGLLRAGENPDLLRTRWY